MTAELVLQVTWIPEHFQNLALTPREVPLSQGTGAVISVPSASSRTAHCRVLPGKASSCPQVQGLRGTVSLREEDVKPDCIQPGKEREERFQKWVLMLLPNKQNLPVGKRQGKGLSDQGCNFNGVSSKCFLPLLSVTAK